MKRREHQDWNRVDLLLGKLAVGEITPDERRELDRCAEDDGDIRASVQAMTSTVDDIRAARGDAFSPGFTPRVIDRVRPIDVSSGISDRLLASLFARLAPVALAVALIVGIYNAATTDADSPVDALLGIESVTVAAAYDDALTEW